MEFARFYGRRDEPKTIESEDIIEDLSEPSGRFPFRKVVVIVGILAAVACAVAVMMQGAREPPLVVQIGSTKKATITRKVSAVGKLQAAMTVKVSSNVSGDLLELPVKEGDFVRKGQVVARIESQRHGSQVKFQQAAKASASADVAAEGIVVRRLETELRRVRRLAALGNASQAEVDQAASEVRAAKAKLQAARQRITQADATLAEAKQVLSFATLLAPMDGVVVTRSKEIGERVRGSDLNEDPILTIATLSKMEARVEVGEHEVVYLHEGDKATVEIDAFPDRTFPAQVVEVARNGLVKNPGTEAEVTTFPVRLTLVQQVPGALPGMSCQAEISTETRENVLVVPIQAVTVRAQEELDGKGQPAAQPAESGQGSKKGNMRKAVFVVHGGKAAARPVQVGLASADEIEITSGLSENEKIVVGPYRILSRELKNGARVEHGDPKKGSKGEATP